LLCKAPLSTVAFPAGVYNDTPRPKTK